MAAVPDMCNNGCDSPLMAALLLDYERLDARLMAALQNMRINRCNTPLTAELLRDYE